ncbi:geranylgeranylglycerol-phosphate geranylgeranyltransferase [Methanothermobacter thermautotrophicus]|uniref:Digeranylgeranylglyceryl phosphate synthase n=2 Tax=Methanothermobacter thermautotrophicus TaxID=145262 RepID=DGGGP_METTH|nr:UbiA family prenyltransferase [Methanothermobacter thermautotrophicus]O27170.1 RecName: Full=Digeranylgeranylglyceryl phosphate synthase; Short=DGGGP synthase; Short=DGGGPS; AltName: Full=(S)-2,3-di-O-geranylgeranylglyceryl phosphate synthase; AltName: Full=Geranylgeranylglycerol-phosphate geranylgeranyltransferase [Methanothermobacter thermautotrophicus str. Delta H]AAB85587.1 bacteriochlorophyll synthase related protein [Methanothermobacter thermautotrophicus str. Delta H]MBE2900295.1 geran
MNPYIEILRPVNAVMAVITVMLMALITGRFDFSVLLASVVVFTATGAGNVINDYFDHEIDAINRPERPIPSGRISRGVAGVYSIILFALASLMGFYLGLLPGLVVVSSSLLMVYYAWRLKKRCLVGNITISFLTGLSFVFGGIVLGEVRASILLGFYAFLMTMAREIVKDMEDVEGDRAEGATTLPITHGMRISGVLAASFMLIASLTSPSLYLLGIFSALYIPVLLLAVAVFLRAAIMILRGQDRATASRVSRMIKVGMALTFIAFAAGSGTITALTGLS